jgi:hypothetical protein
MREPTRQYFGEVAPPLKVGKLQQTLHAKAKGSPKYRFYALYDKVYRADVLWHAYLLFVMELASRRVHFAGCTPIWNAFTDL